MLPAALTPHEQRPHATGVFSRLLPAQCWLCQSSAYAPLCKSCRASAFAPRARCPVCAIASDSGRICGQCLREPPAFEATFSAASYGPLTKPLVHQFKFQQTPGLARWLAAQLLAQAHVSHALREVDSITAIPLSSAGLARRGYNQAWELAKAVSRAAKRPRNAHLLARLRDGPDQVGLKLSERRRNIKDAFACTQEVRGLHIAVVDDVMTSGATLEEAAVTLKRAGAARVTNLVLLRTEL